MKSLIALVALYVVAVCTPFGQRAENAMFVGYGDPALIFRILYSVGPPPLKWDDTTIILGLALIALVGLIRRKWLLTAASLGVPAATIGSSYLISRYILPRPDISDAPPPLIAVSFPSGHTSIAAGLVLGAILVATPRARPYVAAVGTLWLAFTAAAILALYWHRPSDVVGATLIACIWYGVATRLLPGEQSMAKTPTVLVLALAAVGASVGGWRTDGYTRPLIFAATGLLCAVIVWFTVVRRSPAAAATPR